MPLSFSLADEPFLQVRYLDGRTSRLGLRGLFTDAAKIADFESPHPPAAAAMLRVLYGMAFRIAAAMEPALADGDVAAAPRQWLRARNSVLATGQFDPGCVQHYFDAVGAGLDLFDAARPAFQDPRLVQECVGTDGKPSPSGVNKLVAGRPSGVNGAILFGHGTDAAASPVHPGAAIWEVLTQSYFGPCGQCTPRRIKADKPGNGMIGPLRGTVSYHPWGPDLFTTLLLGLPCPDPDHADLAPAEPFPWERADLPDALAPAEALSWPAGVLTGRSRHAVLLVPDRENGQIIDAYVTWSTKAAPSPALDPYLIYDTGKGDELQPRKADLDRSVWRDLDALMMDRAGTSRPAIFRHTRWMPSHLRPQVRVRALGFAQERGQQRDFGWYSATTPPLVPWFHEHDPAMALRFEQCRTAAESLGKALQYAAKQAWADVVARGKIDAKKPGPWVEPTMTAYWSDAETIFWELTQSSNTRRPHLDFRSAAETALTTVISTQRRDIRIARALQHARALLWKAVPTPATPVGQ
ncbi:CRISPR-associated protein, Cse1 family [Glycomyces sambucus]|uniref:CRISPR-associated protein, Cse1 family n=1 Tax=Glycomyces sambucus TaxID=380244 RepID=A0A1G9CMB0_9ACTN|nr:type I-E CRISPR-associated protein Cse1/CasA [Glycomyces sambucus]SDK52729.1 CRISPR-associated protein, Cse1 family [Glycomyces sambucus]